jgi:glycosyl transferase family 87
VTANVYGLRLLRRPQTQRLVVVLILAVVLLARLAQFLYWTGQIQWGYDFSFYWTAGAHLLHGESIYSAQQLAGPYAPQGQEGFLYPPPFAAAMVPFAAAFADPRRAEWLWTAFGAAIVLGAVLALHRSERIGECYRLFAGRGRWLLVGAAFAFPPVVAELVLGNVNILLLGLFTAAWLGIRRSMPAAPSSLAPAPVADAATGIANQEGIRPHAADDPQRDRTAATSAPATGTAATATAAAITGVAIGLATVVKLFPGVLVLWLLLTRRYRAAAWAVIAAAVFVAITLPVTGLQPWLDYPTVLANLSAPKDTTDTLAPTVWLAPFIGFTLARMLVTIAGLAILVWTARSKASTSASFAIAVLVSVLIAPALYQHYLAILVLPMILALGAGIPLRWIGLAYLLMSGGQQDALGDFAWIVNKGLPTAGVLLLLGLFLASQRHEGLRDDDPRDRERTEHSLGRSG